MSTDTVTVTTSPRFWVRLAVTTTDVAPAVSAALEVPRLSVMSPNSARCWASLSGWSLSTGYWLDVPKSQIVVFQLL